MTGVISISSTNWFPISAEYAGDSYLTLSPEYIRNRDGYTVFHHNIFDHARDVVFNKQTNFLLTSALPLLYFIQDTPYSDNRVGAYIRIRRNNGVLYTRGDDTIGLSAVNVDDRSFYRMLFNEDDTVSILQSNSLYMTIDSTPPFNVTLLPKITDITESIRQRFQIIKVTDEELYLIGFIPNSTGYGPAVQQRFISFSPITSSIRAIGVIADDDYSISNPYIFTIEGYEDTYFADGMTSSQSWVQYYNELVLPKYNRGVEVQTRFDDIRVHRLVDVPTNSQISIQGDRGTMKVNIANLKTVLTPEYRNYVRPTLL